MGELFKDLPETLANTMEVAEKVEPINLNSDPIMPKLSEKGISIVLEKRSPIPLIPVDETKIRQLLLNLIRNAAESIEEKGAITCAIESDGKTITPKCTFFGKFHY